MNAAALARIAFGSVFLISGALKLRDRSWPEAARSMGAPAYVVPLVAPVEIVLGALIVAGVGSGAVVLCGLVLLVVFSAVLVRVLRQPVGERPRCACFGNWSSDSLSPASLLRNAAFVALGVVALVA